MIIASVVLPSPGGPDSSTWSGVRPRDRAGTLVGVGAHPGQRLGPALEVGELGLVEGGGLDVVVHGHALLRVWSASRSSLATSGSPICSASRVTALTALSASLPDQPR